MNKHNIFALMTFVFAVLFAAGCIMPVGPGAGQTPPPGGGLPPMAVPNGMVIGMGGGTCSVSWPTDKTFTLKNDSPTGSMKYAMLMSNAYQVHPCDMQKVIQFTSTKMPAGSVVGPMLLVPPGFEVRYITDVNGTVDADVVIYEWKRGFDMEPVAVGHRGLYIKTPWLGSDQNAWYVNGNWKPLI